MNDIKEMKKPAYGAVSEEIGGNDETKPTKWKANKQNNKDRPFMNSNAKQTKWKENK